MSEIKIYNQMDKVASKHLKRNLIGTEIDPKYFEIAQHRLNEPEAEDEFFVME